jgi:hypothetical protein
LIEVRFSGDLRNLPVLGLDIGLGNDPRRCRAHHQDVLGGATVAWLAAQLRPDRFPAVIALSVPSRARGAVRPTTVMPQTDEAIWYQLYFQEPGVAEAEYDRNVRPVFHAGRIGISGDAPPGTRPFGMVPRRGSPFRWNVEPPPCPPG